MKYLIVVCTAVICLAVSSPDHLVYAADEDREVEASFKRFNEQWMERLYSKEKKCKENLVCKQIKDTFIAEYTGYSRTYSSRTKRTDYKETPFIGILVYHEQKFVSQAKTFEEAINGQFILLDEYPVTEIFSFSGGTWLY